MKNKPLIFISVALILAGLTIAFFWPKRGRCERCGNHILYNKIHSFLAGPTSEVRALGGASALKYCDIHGHVPTKDNSQARSLHDWEYERDSYDTDEYWKQALEALKTKNQQQ